MSTLPDINTDITNIDAIGGLVTKASLVTVLLDITSALLASGTLIPADTTALQALSGAMAGAAFVPLTGLFTYVSVVPGGGIPTGSYPAAGGGYWKRQDISSISSLLDTAITNPVDGHVLRYNDSTAKWENLPVTISALSWSNITAKPGKVLYMDTNNNLKADGGTNPTLDGSGTPVRNLSLIGRALSFLTLLTDNILFSTAAALLTSAFNVTGSIIMGNPGTLNELGNAGALTNIIAIGTNGVWAFVKDRFGQIHIGAPVAGYTPSAGNNVYIWGTNAYIAGQLRIEGAANEIQGYLNATGPVDTSYFFGEWRPRPWTNATRPTNPTNGTSGYNTDAGSNEYYNAGIWTSY